MLWFGAVDADYLSLMRIPVMAGRNFTRADGEKAARVALVSASTAKHFWPRESAIGKHVKVSGEQQWRTVVGVVGDVKQYSLTSGLPAWVAGAVYMPYAQSLREDGQIPAAMTLLVKTQGDIVPIVRELQRVAKEQAPDVPVGLVQLLENVVAGSMTGFRSIMRIFLAFAAAALLLAAIGIYGLMSYWVSQRTYEIGLRATLGATRREIVAMILAQGLRVSLYGVLAGIAAALLLTRFLSSLLYGVAAADALTFAAVTLLVLVVALLATAFPAWRASRIDPVKALRAE